MAMTDKSNENSSGMDYVETDHGVLSESGLWRAVLAQAISDTALGDRRQQLEVARWMKTRDFETVCDFADINNILIKGQIENLLTMTSRPLRKHYSRLLCKSISDRSMKRERPTANGEETSLD